MGSIDKSKLRWMLIICGLALLLVPGLFNRNGLLFKSTLLGIGMGLLLYGILRVRKAKTIPKRYCLKCGRLIKTDGSVYCPGCGTKLDPEMLGTETPDFKLETKESSSALVLDACEFILAQSSELQAPISDEPAVFSSVSNGTGYAYEEEKFSVEKNQPAPALFNPSLANKSVIQGPQFNSSSQPVDPFKYVSPQVLSDFTDRKRKRRRNILAALAGSLVVACGLFLFLVANYPMQTIKYSSFLPDDVHQLVETVADIEIHNSKTIAQSMNWDEKTIARINERNPKATAVTGYVYFDRKHNIAYLFKAEAKNNWQPTIIRVHSPKILSFDQLPDQVKSRYPGYKKDELFLSYGPIYQRVVGTGSISLEEHFQRAGASYEQMFFVDG